ncbi:MAG: hypothetical protein IPL41_02935 [Micropruina sp.]|nr:hypothetical protein [Micropruina sp.]
MASRDLLDVEVRYVDERGDAVAAGLAEVDAEAFDGELGAGEFEGRRVTVLEPDQPASFRNEMQGRNLDWIQQELKTVAAKRPDLTHNAGPIGCDGE